MGDRAPYAGAAGRREPHQPVDPGRIVGLGAVCHLDSSAPTGDLEQSFSVAEFVALADGRRVTLHAERGFTRRSSSGRVMSARGGSREALTRDVLNTVLPDDDRLGEDHPWEWLAGLARASGLQATAEGLRELPYEVLFTDETMRWLAGE